jgi:uncharacterized membrane protein
MGRKLTLRVAHFCNWAKQKLKAIREMDEEKWEKKLGSKIAGIEIGVVLVYLMILVYTTIFSYFMILKHYAFKTYAWDLGINIQALSTTLNEGKFLYYTPELFFNVTGCYFRLHFSPILLLVLPVYAINQTPETLFVFQSFIIALGALPLYWYVKHVLSSRVAALGFASVYLLYPPLHGANWFDFHVQAFMPLFFFLSMYYFEQEKWGKYFLFLILALAIAESVPIVVAFVGIYGILKYRDQFYRMFRRKPFDVKKISVPLSTIALAFLWLWFSRWVQNTFFPINPVFENFYRALDYWSVLGIKDDPLAIPIYIILNPARVVDALMYDAYFKLLFLVMVFGSLLFLPLKSSIVLIAFAWLGPALLSNEQKFYVLGSHYPLYIIPFIFFAAVKGLNKTHQNGFVKFGKTIKYLLLVGAIFAIFASPLSPLLSIVNTPSLYFSEYYVPKIGEHELALQRIVNLVPKNASVLTQNHVFSHFAYKSNAYVYPLPQVFAYAPEETRKYAINLMMKADYIVIDTNYDQETAYSMLSNVKALYRYFSLYKLDNGVYLYSKRR